MATTGWTFPTTVAQTFGIDGDRPWLNPNNIKVDDANAASCVLDTREQTNLLLCTDFDWVTPPTGVINGVMMRYRRNSNTDDDIREQVVRLVVAGDLAGSPAVDPSFWDTSLETISKGHATDKWGLEEILVSTVTASDFGVALLAIDDRAGSGDTPRIEMLQLNIDFTATTPGGGGDGDPPGTGIVMPAFTCVGHKPRS